MDRRLKEAAAKGDVLGLRSLMEEDENIIKQTDHRSINTVLHLAARFGHEELASEIIKSCPEMVSSENVDLETPLHEACREGHLGMIKLLMERDKSIVYKLNSREQSPFFAACERGNINAVKHLMNFPRLFSLEMNMSTSSIHAAASSGHTEDLHGRTPLHVACSEGHLDVTREILKLDSYLSSIQDREGKTPLHYASVGHTEIVKEILRARPYSAWAKDFHGDGNTVLHLATAGRLTEMVTYLLKFGTEVNSVSHQGYTALDVAQEYASYPDNFVTVQALRAAGATTSAEVPVAKSFAKRSSKNVARMNSRSNKNLDASHSSHQPRHQKQKRQRRKQLDVDLYTESLRNARNTITIVAVLIATVTFAAGINPPGGFNQVTGNAVLGKQTSFKVFLVCNIVALFLSLSIVNVLVSIIPFERKSMMKLLTITHKLMWISTLFMASAFIAAIWAIMPKGKGRRFVEVELVVIGGGCTITVFCGLGIMLARHWYKKHKWRKEKEKNVKDGTPKSNSSNSDVDCSEHVYYSY
ncbi:ankyrin repeat-containing At5g02620-like [Olea europaea subsp. europaea]|uniref:Ankyrin repeat-containing At5g02620-like n=1 Tax=Olea europaea subsp. europaea TaxID=158383 RepID=A0A8S0PZK3_OLEEU|nr:ankyrin repeat-containing At5g02620-like [Olea europaea subsp. europaea]